MSFSKVELFNLALSACGADLGVSAPDEQSREADLCRLWYSTVLDMVISTAAWPSVRAYSRLALLTERDPDALWLPADPDPQWRYAYAVPSDLLHPYHLSTFERFEYSSARISANAEQPILYYNRRVDDPALWDQGLRDALIHMLAAKIARPLTGKSTIVQQNFELAQIAVQNAQGLAANSQEMPTESMPDWLQARGTTLLAPDKFIYPFQRLSVEKLA